MPDPTRHPTPEQKFIMIALLLLLSAGLQDTVAMPTTSSNPTLSVPECGTKAVAAINSIELSSGKSAFPAATHIQVCWTEEYLSIDYQAMQDTWLKNDHMTCNTETWQQEVVELFIADKPNPRSAFVTSYLEVEISPQNTLYVARISNPFGNGTNKTNQMIDCSASGIAHSTRIGHNSYNANVTVPWTNIYTNGAVPKGSKKGSILYGNFFRVLMETPVDSCDPSTCKYGAWSPTFDVPPQFHVTTVFGEIELV